MLTMTRNWHSQIFYATYIPYDILVNYFMNNDLFPLNDMFLILCYSSVDIFGDLAIHIRNSP